MLDELEVLDSQPLSYEIWETPVPKNLKLPPLVKFDGCNNTFEHAAFINTLMAIIRAHKSLKCKILSDAFRDTS